MNVTFEVHDNAIQSALGKMIEEVEHPEGYLNAIGQVLQSNTQLRFHDGKGPDGSPWLPVIRGGAPLRDTGAHLMNAVSHSVEGNSVLVGVPYAWAVVHQEGRTIQAKSGRFLAFKIGDRWSRKRQVTIPARPFLGISPGDRQDIVGLLNERLLG